MQARWNGALLAHSDDTVVVENNHYFPIQSLNMKYFKDSDRKSNCIWKGEASYYSVVVDGKENKDAAFFYARPKAAASQIKDRVAFWQGVEVI